MFAKHVHDRHRQSLGYWIIVIVIVNLIVYLKKNLYTIVIFSPQNRFRGSSNNMSSFYNVCVESGILA